MRSFLRSDYIFIGSKPYWFLRENSDDTHKAPTAVLTPSGSTFHSLPCKLHAFAYKCIFKITNGIKIYSCCLPLFSFNSISHNAFLIFT